MNLPLPAVPPSVSVLGPFVDAGIFTAGEIQVAAAVARHATDLDPAVVLAVAVAARAPALGHVGLELARAAERLVDHRTVATEAEDLPWPDLSTWRAALEQSAVVANPARAAAEPLLPLVWDGTRIYLHRYWSYELDVADVVTQRCLDATATDDRPEVAGALDALFGVAADGRIDLQRRAAERALTNPLAVIAGGPGTGKTRTIARLIAAAHLAAGDGPPPEIALAAPTGKAAARMTEAVRQAVDEAQRDHVISAELAELLRGTQATTMHALLGWAPGPGFRHDRHQPLPHDLVVIDETSMVSLPLMARLLDAVRPSARVTLVGDPDQLASVDAGTVMADLVGPVGGHPGSGDVADPPQLFPVDPVATSGVGLESRVTVLDTVYRFGAISDVARLAAAVRTGDAETALGLLGGSSEVVRVDPQGNDRQALQTEIVDAAVTLSASAIEGDALAALDAAARVKILAAVRHGDGGLYDWTGRIEAEVRRQARPADPHARFYVGRPIMVTANDRANRLANGDTGIVVAGPDGPSLAMAESGGVRRVPLARLSEVETWWAMTIHKSQGSEFDHVVVTLPEVGSPILTRELLYTAITRAKRRVSIVATEAAVRAAIEHPVSRASGLGPRLWSG